MLEHQLAEVGLMGRMKQMPRAPSGSIAGSRPLALLCAYAVLLALITAWASHYLTVAHTVDAVYNMAALVDGRPLRFGTQFQHESAFYNTQIVAGLNTLFSRTLTFLSPTAWYLLIRIGTFAIAFGVFLIGVRASLGVSARNLLPVATLFGLATITTFNHPFEHPTDALDIACQVAGALLAIRGRWSLTLLVAVILAANKEYAAYVGISWFVLAPPRPLPRRLLEAAAISIASVICVIALREIIGHSGDTGYRFHLFDNVASFSRAIVHFEPGNWLTVSAAVVVMCLAWLDLSNPLVVRLVCLAGCLALPVLTIDLVAETRTLLPSYAMLAIAAAVSTRRDAYSPAPPAGVGVKVPQ